MSDASRGSVPRQRQGRKGRLYRPCTASRVKGPRGGRDAGQGTGCFRGDLSALAKNSSRPRQRRDGQGRSDRIRANSARRSPILRVSWVQGQGGRWVRPCRCEERTMRSLAEGPPKMELGGCSRTGVRCKCRATPSQRHNKIMAVLFWTASLNSPYLYNLNEPVRPVGTVSRCGDRYFRRLRRVNG